MSNIFLRFRSFVKVLPPLRAIKAKKKKRSLLSEGKLEKAISTFVDKKLSHEEYIALIADMKSKADEYGFSFDEYFLLQLNEKTNEEIGEYISDFEHVIIAEKMNRARNQAIFDDKSLTVKHFGRYYHRAYIFVSSTQSGVHKMRDFSKNHGDFIFKPVEMAGGGGIEIVRANDIKTFEKVSDKLLKHYKNGALVEELIKQVPEMNRLHPASVNTLRIPTIRVSNDETVIFHPFLRVGRGDSVVDNASSGGIICALDPDTGVVIAAADERGRTYETHPETGCQLIGFQVPRYSEAVARAKELAEVIPSNRYTGWDLALTENGWVMIEGNARGQFVWQYSTKEGCRSELYALFRKMGIKYRRK